MEEFTNFILHRSDDGNVVFSHSSGVSIKYILEEKSAKKRVFSS